MAKVNEQAVIQLIIKGEQSKTTVKEVRTAMIGLERQLVNMKKEDDPAGFAKLRKELEATKQAHGQMIAEIKGGQGSLKELSLGWKDIMAGFIGGSIATNALDLIKEGIVSTVSRAGELSDSFADVGKATGMTKYEVEQLNSELQLLNTRTPVEELRKLAEMGGRFGVEKEEIADFVKSADMLNVAFGDQFDSVEQLADQTLKLRNIFQDIKSDDIGADILHIGNAMNVLEASGAATGKGLADFSSRIGGVAIPLGMTTADVLGLSAALEELNVTPERGSTAVTTILQKMLTDTQSFAKVAKMSVKDFTHLLNTDLLSAFMAFAKGAKEGGATATAFAKILADTELTGSGASEVLLKLASNQELVAEKVRLSGAAIQNTNSVTGEFNVKNENAAAVLERLGKALTNTWDNISNGVAKGIESFGRLVGWVNTMNESTSKYYAQQQKVNGLQSGMIPLINRYEQLKKQTVLNKDEQAEMKNILDKVASVLPNSVTKFDDYGNAIEFSTGKAREAIEVQKSLLKVLNKDAVREVDQEIAKAQRGIASGKKLLSTKSGTVEFQIGKGQVIVPRTEEVTQQIIRKMQEQVANLEELKKKRKELLGEVDIPSGADTKTNENSDAEKLSNKLEADRLTAERLAADAKSRAKYTNEFILKNQQDLTLSLLKDQEKELQAAQYKYQELRERAKGHAADIKVIKEQEEQEVSQINNKYLKKHLTDFDKTMRGQLDFMNAESKAKNDFEKAQAEKSLGLAGDEFEILKNKYDEQLILAELNGHDKLQVYANYVAELNKLMQEQSAKEIVDYQKVIDEKKKADKEAQDAKREALNAELNHIEQVSEVATYVNEAMGNILSLSAKNQEQNAEFQKAVALFQITIDTAKAISAAIAVAASTSSTGWDIAVKIGAAVLAVTTAIVKAKAIMNEANQPKAPSFREHGGSTDLGSIQQDNSGNPEGWVTRPTLFNLGRRSYVAGEKYKKEYVLSNAMLKDPAIADFVGGVEALRQQRYFEHGGNTALSPAQQQAFTDMTETNRLLRMLVSKPDQWNYSVFETYKNDVDAVRNRANA